MADHLMEKTDRACFNVVDRNGRTALHYGAALSEYDDIEMYGWLMNIGYDKSHQIKSNQIKSNQIKSNQNLIKSSQIKSNQIKANKIKIKSKSKTNKIKIKIKSKLKSN